MDKPWVRPLTVAGSNENEEIENTPQEKCKIKHACVFHTSK